MGDEGVSIRAVQCATREDAGPPECVLHPGDRASHGKRWCSDAPFGEWKPDSGGPALALLWFLPRLVNRSFSWFDPHSAGPLVPPYGCEGVGWDKRTIRQADGRRGGLHSCSRMRNARGRRPTGMRAPSRETAHPTANAGVRMRRLSNGNRILVGRCSLCCGSCRDLLTDPFRGSIPLRCSACPTLRMRGRRVGQANHQADRWTTRGSPSAQSNAQCGGAPAHRNACSIPGDRASHGKRWCSDAPFVEWKPDSGGPCLALLWFLPRLVNRSFSWFDPTPLVRLSHPTDARA